ncbi:MAG: hypothetical protein KAT71_07240, partial [Gammaproteobacteria bacterium]|nr:hypothetical protein [Gammaproteobacteria bacterium]
PRSGLVQYLENLRYQESMADSSYNSGKVEGKIEGIIEEKHAVAKKMQAAGISIELIKQLTELDEF